MRACLGALVATLVATPVIGIAPANAAALPQIAGHVTGTFADSVRIYDASGHNIGQIATASVVGLPVLGVQASNGNIVVLAPQGQVMVKPEAVQTDMAAQPPAVTPCVSLGGTSVDSSSNSTNNLGASCTRN